jgi:hypothetical protein
MVATRLQLIFRDGVGDRRLPDAPFWRTQSVRESDPFQVMVAVGHLEAEPGLMTPEKVVDVLFGADARGLMASVHGTPYDRGLEWAHESSLPEIVRGMTTSKPAEAGSRYAFGSLFVRETRFPTTPDRTSYALVGMAVVRRGSLPERVMFELEGQGLDLVETDRRNVPEAFEIGSSLGQTYGLPVWGWGLPTRAIGNTLPLPVIDAIRRIHELEALPDPTDEQKREVAVLGKGPAGSVLSSGRSDPQYQRFRKMLREMGRIDILSPTDDYPDAKALAERSESVDRAIRELLASDEDDFAPSLG